MGLLDFFKTKTPLDEIKNSFRFLTAKYGFQLINEEIRTDFKAMHFLVYCNKFSKLQLETLLELSVPIPFMRLSIHEHLT